MSGSANLMLTFYGDDFTGSTDALEFITRAGAKTVLFLKPPTERDLAKFGDLDAFGVAGNTRALPPGEMQKTLQEAFTKLAALGPRHVHYKVCSTFDSSPEIGNLGEVIKLGKKQFKNTFVPIVVPAPHLGRYVAFGNLFARMGTGNGAIFRIDQHPSMAHHPVTPAKEGDLRDHLALQCDCRSGLIDVLDLEGKFAILKSKLADLIENNDVVFFDGIYDQHMAIIGKALDSLVAKDSPLFTIGSSGVGKALGDHWQQMGLFSERDQWENLTEVENLLVLSGSVSPVTEAQINYALNHGFKEVLIAPESLLQAESDISAYSKKITGFLEQGHSVIVHTSKGPNDQRLAKTRALCKDKDWDPRRELPKKFGSLLGKTARRVLDGYPLQRLVIAGGDTSSYLARELGITAVEMIAPLIKGAPLCKAFAKNSPVDGMQINLKGGQVGEKTYFVEMKNGRLND